VSQQADTSEMVELALRIVTSAPMDGLLGEPPTLEDIERFKIHVIRMRLRGYLTQELALRLIHRADLRALTLLP
jgi:hypothetical protein